jgi:hypothetical protein
MMKPKTEVFDDPEAFRRAAFGKAKQPRKAARDARPAIPRAVSGEGDRTKALGRIARAGFMPRWRAGAGHDFWHTDGRTTTAHASYRAAVIAAEREIADADA